MSRAKSFLLMVIYVCIALHCINFTICSLNDYGYFVRIVQSDSCTGYKRYMKYNQLLLSAGKVGDRPFRSVPASPPYCCIELCVLAHIMIVVCIIICMYVCLYVCMCYIGTTCYYTITLALTVFVAQPLVIAGLLIWAAGVLISSSFCIIFV